MEKDRKDAEAQRERGEGISLCIFLSHNRRMLNRVRKLNNGEPCPAILTGSSQRFYGGYWFLG